MHRTIRLSFMAAALSAAAAVAAPTTPDENETTEATEPQLRLLPEASDAAGGSTGSRTIDLLIDMQQRSAGLQFNERQQPAGSRDVRTRVSQSAPAVQTPYSPPASGAQSGVPPTPASGLFGSGAVPMVQAARTASVDTRGAPGLDPAPQRRAGTVRDGEPLPRWLLLPREIIEYVRENRWAVLSSVACGLLLIWGISALFARAAARAGRVPGPKSDRALSADRWVSMGREARRARHRSHRRPG
jgi:hypothetical protein